MGRGRKRRADGSEWWVDTVGALLASESGR